MNGVWYDYIHLVKRKGWDYRGNLYFSARRKYAAATIPYGKKNGAQKGYL